MADWSKTPTLSNIEDFASGSVLSLKRPFVKESNDSREPRSSNRYIENTLGSDPPEEIATKSEENDIQLVTSTQHTLVNIGETLHHMGVSCENQMSEPLNNTISKTLSVHSIFEVNGLHAGPNGRSFSEKRFDSAVENKPAMDKNINPPHSQKLKESEVTLITPAIKKRLANMVIVLRKADKSEIATCSPRPQGDSFILTIKQAPAKESGRKPHPVSPSREKPQFHRSILKSRVKEKIDKEVQLSNRIETRENLHGFGLEVSILNMDKNILREGDNKQDTNTNTATHELYQATSGLYSSVVSTKDRINPETPLVEQGSSVSNGKSEYRRISDGTSYGFMSSEFQHLNEVERVVYLDDIHEVASNYLLEIETCAINKVLDILYPSGSMLQVRVDDCRHAVRRNGILLGVPSINILPPLEENSPTYSPGTKEKGNESVGIIFGEKKSFFTKTTIELQIENNGHVASQVSLASPGVQSTEGTQSKMFYSNVTFANLEDQEEKRSFLDDVLPRVDEEYSTVVETPTSMNLLAAAKNILTNTKFTTQELQDLQNVVKRKAHARRKLRMAHENTRVKVEVMNEVKDSTGITDSIFHDNLTMASLLFSNCLPHGTQLYISCVEDRAGTWIDCVPINSFKPDELYPEQGQGVPIHNLRLINHTILSGTEFVGCGALCFAVSDFAPSREMTKWAEDYGVEFMKFKHGELIYALCSDQRELLSQQKKWCRGVRLNRKRAKAQIVPTSLIMLLDLQQQPEKIDTEAKRCQCR
eukprot:TRINITY_DN10999_c0_g2_i1.p1 TRINITY_DN10999_c0_g2~~TRINITY_DN10999_c0_g2_i1.p1  ORF type:complete len:761 (+),score=35.29 TRINITY_DN10999_c0_g2_i1:2-2284(+)